MSLFDIIKGKDWGATLGSLADKAKSGASDLTRNTPGGMGGLLGAGALGALLGSVLSKDVLQNAALVGAGAVAWNFYKKWSDKKEQGAASQQAAASFGMAQPAAAPAGPVPGVGDPTAMLLLRAMIFAARADGHIDATEQDRISKMVAQMFPGQDASQLVNSLLNEPINPAVLAGQVCSAEQGEDLYRLSCLIVDIDHFMERSYLDGLAQALHILPQRKDALELESAQAKQQLAVTA